jgi:C4-dicarboxylate-specific signal transduction histidine kinase
LAGSVKCITESGVTKQKLETLLADLIENAIIATSYSTYKRIFVTMGIVDDCLEINIQDSGIPFEVEVLANLGLVKSTTHADTGGSGIGYMTIFEILRKYAASLTITEYIPENYAFTKSIVTCRAA